MCPCSRSWCPRLRSAAASRTVRVCVANLPSTSAPERRRGDAPAPQLRAEHERYVRELWAQHATLILETRRLLEFVLAKSWGALLPRERAMVLASGPTSHHVGVSTPLHMQW